MTRAVLVSLQGHLVDTTTRHEWQGNWQSLIKFGLVIFNIVEIWFKNTGEYDDRHFFPCLCYETKKTTHVLFSVMVWAEAVNWEKKLCNHRPIFVCFTPCLKSSRSVYLARGDFCTLLSHVNKTNLFQADDLIIRHCSERNELYAINNNIAKTIEAG